MSSVRRSVHVPLLVYLWVFWSVHGLVVVEPRVHTCTRAHVLAAASRRHPGTERNTKYELVIAAFM